MMRPEFFDLRIFADAFRGLRTGREKAAAELIRSELLKSRDAVQSLLEGVPADCRGLTIHDVTHLDALWEMADLLSSGNVTLNPSEVFVLGVAILLHDAGLTSTAYPGGVSDLEETTIWKDYESVLKGRLQVEGLSLSNSEFLDQLKFNTLRELHADKAEELATQEWKNVKDGTSIFIVESEELRSNYGRGIGRIAASHHWDVSRLYDLRDKVGASPSLPGSWSVDERKLAALLRVSDIAHIDKRRAPSMHYAVRRPVGLSELHWRFQNKMAKPALKSNALLYSGEDFSLSEAPSWWLAADTVSQIDREIIRTNSALADFGSKELYVTGVVGANAPRVLARYIPTKGWKPVDASVRVSDASHLAATLGGRNLYGTGIRPPIRELLQNSADAVRARRALEGRSGKWGKISVELRNEANRLTIKVGDSGVGMSEAVMAGPLVDFGKSLWRSDLLLKEHPGLASKRTTTIGRYGIGFFSVFDVSEKASVVSRKYDEAMGNSHQIIFGRVTSRPVLLDAGPKSLPADVNTIVEVTIKPESGGASVKDISASSAALTKEILRMIIGLDIDVEINDLVNKKRRKHKSEMYKISSDTFMLSVYDKYGDEAVESKKILCELLSPLIGENGNRIGRAALNLPKIISGGYAGDGLLVAADGFTGANSTSGYLLDMIGLVAGSNVDISRNRVTPNVTREQLQSWLDGQIEVLLRSGVLDRDLARIATKVVGVDLDPRELPLMLGGRGYVTFAELRQLVSAHDEIWFPAAKNYDGDISLLPPGAFVDEYPYETLDDRVLFNGNFERFSNKALSPLDAAMMEKDGDSGFVEQVLDIDHMVAVKQSLEGEWGKDNIGMKFASRQVSRSPIPYRDATHEVLVFYRRKRST